MNKDKQEIKRLVAIIKTSNDSINVAIAGTMLVKLSRKLRAKKAKTLNDPPPKG